MDRLHGEDRLARGDGTFPALGIGPGEAEAFGGLAEMSLWGQPRVLPIEVQEGADIPRAFPAPPLTFALTLKQV